MPNCEDGAAGNLADLRCAITMIDKQCKTPAEAVADVFDGATVLIGGFGDAGSPTELIHALIDQGASGLTVVNKQYGQWPCGPCSAN